MKAYLNALVLLLALGGANARAETLTLANCLGEFDLALFTVTQEGGPVATDFPVTPGASARLDYAPLYAAQLRAIVDGQQLETDVATFPEGAMLDVQLLRVGDFLKLHLINLRLPSPGVVAVHNTLEVPLQLQVHASGKHDLVFSAGAEAMSTFDLPPPERRLEVRARLREGVAPAPLVLTGGEATVELVRDGATGEVRLRAVEAERP